MERALHSLGTLSVRECQGYLHLSLVSSGPTLMLARWKQWTGGGVTSADAKSDRARKEP